MKADELVEPTVSLNVSKVLALLNKCVSSSRSSRSDSTLLCHKTSS